MNSRGAVTIHIRLANTHFTSLMQPENLLIDSNFSLRVADWGLSAVQIEIEAAVLRTQCGTVSLPRIAVSRLDTPPLTLAFLSQRAYMAPELLRREMYRGATADVWSAGACDLCYNRHNIPKPLHFELMISFLQVSCFLSWWQVFRRSSRWGARLAVHSPCMRHSFIQAHPFI